MSRREQWVLLRGLTRDSRHWGDFPPRFAAGVGAGAGASNIVVLDLPGNGTRHREPSPFSVPAMVEACRADLFSRGIAGPLRVLAMSLGGMVAIEWARRHPDEISHCVLVNTSLRGISPLYRRLRPANYPRLFRMALGVSAADWERTVLALTSARQDPLLAEHWAALRHDCATSSTNALRQLIAAARYRAPATLPPARLLLLGSTCDRLVDIACSRAIAARWSVPLIEHPTAGHDLPLDAPDWVAESVHQWLASLHDEERSIDQSLE